LNQESLTSLSSFVDNIKIEYYEKEDVKEYIDLSNFTMNGFYEFKIRTNNNKIYFVTVDNDTLKDYGGMELEVKPGEQYEIQGFALQNCHVYYLMQNQLDGLVECFPAIGDENTTPVVHNKIITIPNNVNYLYVNINISSRGGEGYVKKISNTTKQYTMNNDIKEKIQLSENALLRNEIAYRRNSTNLFNGKFYDKCLISYSADINNQWRPIKYETSFLVGPQDISENKTYACTNNNYPIGAIIFLDSEYKPICGMSASGIAYGGGENYWPECDGLVDIIIKNAEKAIFTILENSNISYCVWYLGNNYIGNHTEEDVNNYLKNIQINEATDILPYESPSASYNIYEAFNYIDNELESMNKFINKQNTENNTWKLCLNKKGNNVYIRSHFSDDNDIFVYCVLKSQSKSFNFSGWYEIQKDAQPDNTSGTLFKGAGDDICPAHFNSSYRCGNHGDDAGKLITAQNHGLTESDIGTQYTSSNGIVVTIVTIIDENSFLCVSTNQNYQNRGDIALSKDIIQSPLSNNNKTITFSACNNAKQIIPASNNISVKIYINGEEIIEDGIYYSNDFIYIYESYDNIDVHSMVEYLQNHIGSNTNDTYYSDNILDKYVTINNIYRFEERGAVVEIQSIDFDITPQVFTQYGAVQAGGFGDYISVPFSNKNVISLHDGSSSYYLYKNEWVNENIVPHNMYSFSDEYGSNGFCIGINTVFADGKMNYLLNHINQAGFIYNSKKLYPRLLDSITAPQAGESYNCISYRLPLDTYDVDIPAIGYYWLGDSCFIIINCQKTISKYIKAPDNTIGMHIEVLLADGDITIPHEFVQSKGLRINCNNYGYAELKLTK